MEQEKDKTMYNSESKIKFDLSEFEELMSLLDPNEKIFVQTKRLVKEIKMSSYNNSYDKSDDSILRR
jgi:hypothetical protein